MTDTGPLPAGRFSDWLAGMEAALRGEAASDVSCGSCTACCRSSQFVHIGPHETNALAQIPAELLFPAPRMPRGHLLLGYDENGHCPMLADGRCSIYEHRPMTCRTYDCRVFPATGIEPDGEDQRAIAERARRWRFELVDLGDEVLHEAVRAAARFVRERRDQLPDDAVPVNATQEAVLAIRIHRGFLTGDEPAQQAVQDALLASSSRVTGSA